MIDTVSYHSQRKCFDPGNGLLARLSICQDAGEIGYFSDPASIFFFLDIYFHFDFLLRQKYI